MRKFICDCVINAEIAAKLLDVIFVLSFILNTTHHFT